MIQFTIGPLNGDSIDLQIPREGTVRDILMKYVGAFDLSEVEARKCRLIFDTLLLRRRRCGSEECPKIELSLLCTTGRNGNYSVHHWSTEWR